MNLTQQQVFAILDMVELNEKKEFDIKVKASKPTPVQIKKCKEIAKKEFDKYKALPDYIRNNMRNYNNSYTLSQFEQWTEKHFHPTPIQPNSKSEKIKSKIIVMAMGCKTIDDLKKKLKID